MEYVLENEFLKLKFNSLGGELKEIYNKKNGLSYLWDSNPKYWKRSSPILFPNVGKYYNNVYRVDGVEYKQSQHGFARDTEMQMIARGDNFIIFQMDSNLETYKVYPYHFSLVLGYELFENEIKVHWKVKNNDNKSIYFGIGGHPAFNVPLVDEKRSDCYLYFKGKDEIISSMITLDGFSTDKKIVYKLDNGYLNISDDLFDLDALVIENQKIEEVSLCDKSKKPYLTVKMNVPLFGVWSPSKDAPFVCIEPWWGRCDKEGFTGDITEKEFEVELKVNKEFDNEYSIVIE